jgi:hypothetical protein
MRTLSLSRVVLTAALLWGGSALAKREVKDFQPPPEMSQEELEAAKARARNGNMASYSKDIQIKPEPTPWMAIGLGVAVLVAATPFALRVYRNTSKEIATANTFGVSRAHDDEE